MIQLSKANLRTIKRREQRKRAKNKMFTTYNPWDIKFVSMTDQSCAKTSPETIKENPMSMYVDYVSSDKHTESAKTNYLLGRMSTTHYKIREDLSKQYGLSNDDTPYTAK